MKSLAEKIKAWYRNLPEKKKYIEFITAVLSVPVLLTVIILNLNNLNLQKNSTQKTTDEKITPIQVIITDEKQDKKNFPSFSPSPSSYPSPTITPTPTQTSCIKEVGPVSILSPLENEVVTENPVCITVSTQANYCPVVLSYSLNDNNWSDYSDKDICLYGLSNGNKVVQVKIKSNSSDDVITLQRSFVYKSSDEVTITPSPTPSLSP